MSDQPNPTEVPAQEVRSMKNQISEMYSEYGRYINKFRSFPLMQDGLKLVERRLFVSLLSTARREYKKSALVVGHCIGHLHPHGDTSAYGTLVQLVNNGFVDGQGNFGTGVGIHDEPAAAMRYTEVMMNEHTFKLAFEFFDYVPFDELEMESEPIYLPTALPFCLLGNTYTQGIGFGYRTYIPAYQKSDLIARLKWLLHYTTTEPVIKPKTDCIYGSTDEDFKRLLTTGKGKLLYRGKMELDRATKSVIVKSIAPSKTFKSVLKNLENEIQIQKSIGYLDESTTSTRVKFTFTKRGQDVDQLVAKLNNLVTGSVTFECNMCNTEGDVILVSVDQMLLNTYQNYKNIHKIVLEDNISKLVNSTNEMRLIERIKTVLAKWLREFPDDIDALVNGISSDTGIECTVIRQLLDKYTLPKILKTRTDINDLEAKKQIQVNNLNNLDSYVWQHYETTANS